MEDKDRAGTSRSTGQLAPSPLRARVASGPAQLGLVSLADSTMQLGGLQCGRCPSFWWPYMCHNWLGQ